MILATFTVKQEKHVRRERTVRNIDRRNLTRGDMDFLLPLCPIQEIKVYHTSSQRL